MTKPRLSFILPLFLKASFSLLATNSCLRCWGSLPLAWGSLESPSLCLLQLGSSSNQELGSTSIHVLPASASLACEPYSHGLSSSRLGGWGEKPTFSLTTSPVIPPDAASGPTTSSWDRGRSRSPARRESQNSSQLRGDMCLSGWPVPVPVPGHYRSIKGRQHRP